MTDELCLTVTALSITNMQLMIGEIQMFTEALSPNLVQGTGLEADLNGTADKLYVHAMSISHKIAVGALTLSGSSIAFVAMYMVKSAVGIDLFPGPSFMHDTFYIY